MLSFALCEGGIADGNLILEETKESRPPSDANPGETQILQLQSQQETGIVCFFILYFFSFIILQSQIGQEKMQPPMHRTVLSEHRCTPVNQVSSNNLFFRFFLSEPEKPFSWRT